MNIAVLHQRKIALGPTRVLGREVLGVTLRIRSVTLARWSKYQSDVMASAITATFIAVALGQNPITVVLMVAV